MSKTPALPPLPPISPAGEQFVIVAKKHIDLKNNPLDWSDDDISSMVHLAASKEFDHMVLALLGAITVAPTTDGIVSIFLNGLMLGARIQKELTSVNELEKLFDVPNPH